MRVSLDWLSDFVDLDQADSALADRLADGLSAAGLEVEAVERPGRPLEGLVVAEVLSVEPHPNADRLRLCRVNDGGGERSIVCGAPNVAPGQRVVLARPGTSLPDGTPVETVRIRGRESEGMICSARELGVGEDHSGILVLEGETAPPGAPAAALLGLEDIVFDIGVTPNRSDCLSVLGVAREVAALLERPLKLPEVRVEEEAEPAADLCAVEILDPEKCPRYAARLIRGIRVGPSPQWLQRRLRAAGMRPISNVVDVTNYVMLALGQPLHAFDLARLAGGRIVVRRWRAADGPFVTLDSQERRMTEDDLMICDAERPVAIGGVMGGENSEIGEETADVLLESAYFTPATIRRTRRRLGLSSEASYRFERGVDPSGTVRAADMAAELIRRTAGGRVARGAVDVHPAPPVPVKIRLRGARVSAILGREISGEDIRRGLGALGMKVRKRSGEAYQVEVPSFRPDIEREIDLIEEVARRYGYDRFPATLPVSAAPPEPPSERRRFADAVRESMIAAGCCETIHYSFVGGEALARLNAAGADLLALRNPISADMDVMRTTLLAGLLDCAAMNLNRGVEDVRVFEVGRTYHRRGGEALPRERERVAALAAGADSPALWREAPPPGGDGGLPPSLFALKGAIERMAEVLRLPPLEFVPLAEGEGPWEPASSAALRAGGAALGVLGVLGRRIREAWGIRPELAAFELDVDAMFDLERAPLRFRELPRYPATLRDLAVVVRDEIPHASVEAAIREGGGALLESVRLFDLYRGGGLREAGEKSLAYSLVFRRRDRTLTDEEVDEAFEAILAIVADRLGGRLRA